MKSLVLASLILVLTAASGFNAFASDTQISNRILGGAILVIGPKATLVIDNSTNQALEKDLGAKKKQALYFQFIMKKSVKEIRTKFALNKSKALHSLLDNYSKLLKDPNELEFVKPSFPIKTI